MVAIDRSMGLIRDELDRLVQLRREFHQHPEIAYQERWTAGRIRTELDRLGIQHLDGLGGGTGTLAHIPGRSARAVGLRADIDALPMDDAGTQAWRSRTPGRAHACGHDGHITVLLGAAAVLKRLAGQDALPHPVTLIFQPAEEGGNGGERMVADGCLNGSRLGSPVAALFALHGWPSLPVGKVASRPGPMLAAADAFRIRVHGVGGHAAWPHLARDPVLGAAAIVQTLQALVAREVDPQQAAVVTVGSIHAGEAFNVIPASAEMLGTIRTFREDVRHHLRTRLQACVEHTAAALGLRAEVDFLPSTPATVNHAGAFEHFERVARSALGTEAVTDFGPPVMGAEDFAFYGAHVPACFLALGLDQPQRPCPPLHDPTFDFNDAALATGVQIMVALAQSNVEAIR
jgi:amidohydrolase